MSMQSQCPAGEREASSQGSQGRRTSGTGGTGNTGLLMHLSTLDERYLSRFFLPHGSRTVMSEVRGRLSCWLVLVYAGNSQPCY